MMRLLILMALLTSFVASAAIPKKERLNIEAALNAWDIAEATKALKAVGKSHRGDPVYLFLKGRHEFLQGDYSASIQYLQKAVKDAPSAKLYAGYLGLVSSTRSVVREFKQFRTSKGHFIISYRPGVDEVLLPYADHALERAYEKVGEIFREWPAEPVRVEIYPRVENLADVSPLKVSEIRTSGTIALCKYNRLMLVSPRALVYGYPWLDTLTHEYIHLLINRRSRASVPIWLHEGLAKFFETRWRQDKSASLSPTSEDLLADALGRKALIRFDAMSPSIAKLPSQEAAALAFAEVFMVIKLLYERNGVDGINTLLDKMRDGASDKEAVAFLAKKSFKRFEKEWQFYLHENNLRRMPAHARSRLLFKDKDRPTDELVDITHEQARQLTYIGDRLAVRKRYKAASKEYAKALKKIGGPHPIVNAKLASSLLAQGRHKEVPDLVSPALKLNPDYVLLYLYRGKARLALGRYEAARADLISALRINPFDPEVHGLLAKSLEGLGRKNEAETERRHQRIVTSE